ncbi:porin family protein [Microvirga sp. HBU67558]|uniref:outer membrane protein n=1 Tax=Microvirga TaxID=186650 RepID=UPI001B38BAF5|nr:MULTISPECIES: outer membrane beta-barrel protein [unclassified Microvirga]MBQ0822387.1 porin family protein [Microvirga sp. HBU67558]
MQIIKIAALTGLFAAAGSAALAADLSRVFVSSPTTMRDFRESSRGLYLRGTLGYADYKHPEADVAVQPDIHGLSRERLAHAAVIGTGLGYRFNANVRADVTLDHTFDARFKGVVPGPISGTTTLADSGQFQSSTIMANGYLDFRPVMGLTPYVGAGLGVAHNVLSQQVLTIYDPETGIGASRSIAGGDNFSLAWAVMAGVAYQLSSNFTFDLGYRYVSMGDVKTRAFDYGAGLEMESIGAHEMRVGVRYTFN